MEDGFKICPFCKEKIRVEAVKCRFCGEWLEETNATPANPQKEIETVISPPLPIPPEFPTPEKTEKEIVTPKKIRERFSQKTLFWVGVSLLTVSCLLWFLGIISGHWSQLSPPKQGEAIANVVIGLIKILFVAGLVSWGIKGKGEKLLAFSATFTIATLVAAYYFCAARNEAQQKTQASNNQLVSDINSLEEFIKQGAVGNIPELKPTGDADTDAFLAALSVFYAKYFQIVRHANQEIQSLQEKDVFDDSVFVVTNKSILEAEIQKRVAAQKIIEGLSANTLSLIDGLKKQIAIIKISNEYKDGLLLGINNMSSKYDKYFAAQIKTENAEHDYLQFMDGIFDGYQLKDNADTERESSNLVKRVQDGRAEMQGILNQNTATVEAAKAKLQQAGQ
jgi:hypothetical protein